MSADPLRTLNFMSRGNKALTLTCITIVLMACGSVIFFIGSDNSQETGDSVDNDDIFDILRPDRTPRPTQTRPPILAPIIAPTAIIPVPTIASNPPAPVQTYAPNIRTLPPNIFPPAWGLPTPEPILTLKTPAPTPAPTPSPFAHDKQRYPFAIAYECDWSGQRQTLTTKTKSSSVVRLCIQPPPLDTQEEPIEVSHLSWFLFERQPYDGQQLDDLEQHAVILGKPDPFGLTVLDCNKGAPVCKFATDMRDEFFTANAFLQGRGELVLQYTRTKAIAGFSPISIYFLLSSVDIKEPLQLGKRTENSEPVPHQRTEAVAPEPKTATVAASDPNKQKRGWPKRKAPLFADGNGSTKPP